MNEHIKSKQALADAEKENQAREAAWKIAYNKAEQEHQKQLAAYQQEKKKYDDELASKPGMTVTLDKANKLLANNAFPVTVTNNLKSGALVYKQDKLQSGGGEIYIEDQRGKGEHSRTICVNMLGNIKVVKGNESCP